MDDITIAQFRTLVPRFADQAAYPDAQIQAFIDMAVLNFNHCVWGSRLVFGQAAWVAHWLSLYGAYGDMPTLPLGIGPFATNKRVGDVSVGFSEKIAEDAFNNPFMLTPYGRQYWFMLNHLPNLGLMIV